MQRDGQRDVNNLTYQKRSNKLLSVEKYGGYEVHVLETTQIDNIRLQSCTGWFCGEKLHNVESQFWHSESFKKHFFLLCKIINKNIDIQIEKYIPDMFPPPPAPIVCNSCTNHFMLWSMPALVLGWGDVHLVDGWGEEHLVVGGELYKGFGFFVPPAKI